MKGVIFAAGKGKRFLPLTETIPKALITVLERPVIYFALDALTPFVDEFIIIIEHLSKNIISTLGTTYLNKPIRYVSQGEMKGSAGALWSVKEFLKGEQFIVSNCDDVIFAADIKKLLSYNYALGVFPTDRALAPDNVLSVNFNTDGVFTTLSRPQPQDTQIYSATGVYMLDDAIFQETPVVLKSGEYGLPQTLEQFAKKNTVHTVIFSQWLPINSPEEKLRAEETMQQKHFSTLE